MKNLTLKERADLYKKAFPKWPPLIIDKGWLYGVWMIGNNYQGNKFYGSYPPTYLKRIFAMFPDVLKTFHCFAGSLDMDYLKENFPGKHYGIDIKTRNSKHVIKGNAEEISTLIKSKYSLVLADPPYSNEDAEHYGTPLCNRNKVIKELVSIVNPNGFLIWLDQVLPMYRKVDWKLVGTIGMVRSTNHRFRIVSIFQRNKSRV